jgi:hypothetical protein
MEFHKLVIENFEMLIKKYNLKIIEESFNYVKINSNIIEIRIIHDARDSTNSLLLGTIGNYLSPIDDYLLKNYYNSELTFNFESTDEFLSNLIRFFEEDGNSLLQGDLDAINNLDEFSRNRNREYTESIIRNQK